MSALQCVIVRMENAPSVWCTESAVTYPNRPDGWRYNSVHLPILPGILEQQSQEGTKLCVFPFLAAGSMAIGTNLRPAGSTPKRLSYACMPYTNPYYKTLWVGASGVPRSKGQTHDQCWDPSEDEQMGRGLGEESSG